ncbi:MAG: hypothetical protein LBE27_00470 [Deltaproteobacteria bacterium]|nr:hypothetical protein [Deltaproteobacteria bacterium]
MGLKPTIFVNIAGAFAERRGCLAPPLLKEKVSIKIVMKFGSEKKMGKNFMKKTSLRFMNTLKHSPKKTRFLRRYGISC